MSTSRRDELLPPVSLDDFTKAIMNNAINNHEIITENEARQVATYVLNFFGYSSRIIDKALDEDDRDTFYMLEDAGLLITDREETRLPKCDILDPTHGAKEWRIHYWLFKKEKIKELANQSGSNEEPVITGAKSIYNEIPDEEWGYLSKNNGSSPQLGLV